LTDDFFYFPDKIHRNTLRRSSIIETVGS
jgi:hypothetical protein